MSRIGKPAWVLARVEKVGFLFGWRRPGHVVGVAAQDHGGTALIVPLDEVGPRCLAERARSHAVGDVFPAAAPPRLHSLKARRCRGWLHDRRAGKRQEACRKDQPAHRHKTTGKGQWVVASHCKTLLRDNFVRWRFQ
jgi:hypothetical protein